MPKINISGLSKTDIALSLFKNAYNKSAETKAAKVILTKQTRNIPGLYEEIRDYEVQEILKEMSGKIDYLGCVKLNIDFSNNVIDTDTYEKYHPPGKDGVESTGIPS